MQMLRDFQLSVGNETCHPLMQLLRRCMHIFMIMAVVYSIHLNLSERQQKRYMKYEGTEILVIWLSVYLCACEVKRKPFSFLQEELLQLRLSEH
mmetsp:Transcript_6588/g.8912  ORF Transcript_6588/g.8912 Transcript_6588/m.8912 type:complete len:94 (+) Transcript_6588:203-484(+)